MFFLCHKANDVFLIKKKYVLEWQWRRCRRKKDQFQYFIPSLVKILVAHPTPIVCRNKFRAPDMQTRTSVDRVRDQTRQL